MASGYISRGRGGRPPSEDTNQSSTFPAEGVNRRSVYDQTHLGKRMFANAGGNQVPPAAEEEALLLQKMAQGHEKAEVQENINTESKNTEQQREWAEENAEEEEEGREAFPAAKRAKFEEAPSDGQWYLNTCDVANATFFSDNAEKRDQAFETRDRVDDVHQTTRKVQ